MPATDSIMLYLEGVDDARRFMSALRAAARVKPVVVMKAGRHAQRPDAAAFHTGVAGRRRRRVRRGDAPRGRAAHPGSSAISSRPPRRSVPACACAGAGCRDRVECRRARHAGGRSRGRSLAAVGAARTRRRARRLQALLPPNVVRGQSGLRARRRGPDAVLRRRRRRSCLAGPRTSTRCSRS